MWGQSKISPRLSCFICFKTVVKFLSAKLFNRHIHLLLFIIIFGQLKVIIRTIWQIYLHSSSCNVIYFCSHSAHFLHDVADICRKFVIDWTEINYMTENQWIRANAGDWGFALFNRHQGVIPVVGVHRESNFYLIYSLRKQFPNLFKVASSHF